MCKRAHLPAKLCVFMNRVISTKVSQEHLPKKRTGSAARTKPGCQQPAAQLKGPTPIEPFKKCWSTLAHQDLTELGAN